MADNDIRVKLTARDHASSAIDRLGKRLKGLERPTKTLGREMEGVGRATSRIGRFSDGFALPRLAHGLRLANRETAEMRKGLTRLGEGMGALGELGGLGTLSIGAGLASAVAASKRWADLGMQTRIAGRNIGITTGQLYRFQRVAALTGVSGGTLTGTLAGLTMHLASGLTNSDREFENRLRSLGIHAGFARHHLEPLSQLLPQIADKIKAMGPGPLQYRAAASLGLAPLLPLLRRGGPWIQKHMAELKKEGVGGSFGGSSKLYSDFSKFDTAALKLANEIGQDFAPSVDKLINGLTAAMNFLSGGKPVAPHKPITLGQWRNQFNPHAGAPNLPRSLRDNNPLNLSYMKGQIGLLGRDGQFGRFRSTSYGIAAATNQLLIDRSRGDDTIRSLVTSWAPPGSNNTKAYIRDVSKWTGFGPDQKLNLDNPTVMSALVDAMARQEGSGRLGRSDTMAGVKLGYAEFARGAPRELPYSVVAALDRLQRNGAAGGTVTVDINHNSPPPGTTSSVTTSGSARLGSLRISRPDPDAMTALP